MQTAILNDTHLESDLLAIARWHAAMRGITGEDKEDCVMEFVEEILVAAATEERNGQAIGGRTSGMRNGLHRRVRNHTRTFQRALHARRQRHLPWPSCPGCREEGGLEQEWEPAGNALGPGQVALQSEFWNHIASALDSLAPTPRMLFIGRHIQGRAIEELADACGRSSHAVEQALLRARKQVRGVLERRGCGNAALVEYIAALQTSVPA